MVDHHLHVWRRLLTLVLPAAALLLLTFGVLVTLVFQQPTQHLQGGLGGAPQASAAQLPTFTPSVTSSPASPLTPTATPAPKGTLYGGRGPGGTCSNPVGGGSMVSMVQQDFGWGPDHLSPPYRTDTVDLLCNDSWAWFNPNGQNVPANQVLQTLHWPTNLFASPWIDGDMHVSWMAISFPTTPTNVCPNHTNCGVSKDNPACFYSPQIGPFQPTFNFCDPTRSAINATANAIAQGYQQMMGKGFGDPHAAIAFVWETPTAPFQDDKVSGLLTLWNGSWAIVLLCVTAVIAWGALRSMLGSVVSWLAYAQIMELLPRLIFALLAALLSKAFFLMLIQANNAFSLHFSTTIFQIIVEHPNPGIKMGLIQILYGVLGYGLVVEEAARLAFLYALFAASPILFFFAALPETQRWAQSSAVAAVLLTFLQAIQAFLMDVGNSILTSILNGQSGSLTFLQVLVALAVLYLTLTMFFAVLRVTFGPGGYALAGFPLLALAAARWATRGTRRAMETARRGGNTGTGMVAGGAHPNHSFLNTRGTRIAGANGSGPRFGAGPGGSGGTRGPGGPRGSGGPTPFALGGGQRTPRASGPATSAGTRGTRPQVRPVQPQGRGQGVPFPQGAARRRTGSSAPSAPTTPAPGTPSSIRPQGFAGTTSAGTPPGPSAVRGAPPPTQPPAQP